MCYNKDIHSGFVDYYHVESTHRVQTSTTGTSENSGNLYNENIIQMFSKM